MVEFLEKGRTDIDYLMCKNEFEKAEMKLYKYLDEFVAYEKNDKRKDDINVLYEIFFFFYYRLAFCYYKQKKFYDAITSLQLCENYVRENEADYYRVVWFYAKVLEDSGYINKSVISYKKCADYYKVIGNKMYRLIAIFNICKCKGNINRMLKLIKLYKNVDGVDIIKDKYLNDMYEDIFSICEEKKIKVDLTKYINIDINIKIRSLGRN